MKRSVVGVAAIVVAMCSMVVRAPSLYAQSLKDKMYFESQENSLAEQVPYVNQKCDTKIAVKFDWSKPPKPEERTTYSAYSYCQAVLDAMRRVCDSSQAGKNAVKQKIKSLTCGFGPQRVIALKAGAIDYKINYSSVNDVDFVFEYLQNNL
jgi:hypothetical protein